MNEVILGIDLGTTQSAVGVVDSGFPILLADEHGEVLTPSAVWYSADGEIGVGAPAMRRKGVSPVITSVKSLIGRRFHEVDGQDGYHEITEVDGKLSVVTQAGPKLPEEISSEVLKHLKKIAESRLEREVTKAVITVP
ncbi:Hsp70 family protein, partial [Akkermansiaceae bacterium]|nr:Hsp70 family protein [Akkermansiaceae bacterium]